MKLKTFEQFVNEAAIKAGEDSEIVIQDMVTRDGTEISAEEILGLVVSCSSEEEMAEKAYDRFGNAAFSEEEIMMLKKYWNDYSAEKKEAEKEAEEEADGGEDDMGLGDLDSLGDEEVGSEETTEESIAVNEYGDRLGYSDIEKLAKKKGNRDIPSIIDAEIRMDSEYKPGDEWNNDRLRYKHAKRLGYLS
jgi:hypothetical protein